MSKLEGRERTLRKMRAVPKEIRAAIKQAIAQGADEITDMQRRLVPVKSGKLRASIKQTWGDKPDFTTSAALDSGGAVAGDPDLTVWISVGGGDRTDGWYARFVEFGTGPHPQGGKFAGTKHPGTAAQPFFFPAWRLLGPKIKRRVVTATNRAIKRAAAK